IMDVSSYVWRGGKTRSRAAMDGLRERNCFGKRSALIDVAIVVVAELRYRRDLVGAALHHDGVVVVPRLADSGQQAGTLLIDVAIVAMPALRQRSGDVCRAVAMLVDIGQIVVTRLIDRGGGLFPGLVDRGHITPPAVLIDGGVKVFAIGPTAVAKPAPATAIGAALGDRGVAAAGKLIDGRHRITHMILSDYAVVVVAGGQDGAPHGGAVFLFN